MEITDEETGDRWIARGGPSVELGGIRLRGEARPFATTRTLTAIGNPAPGQSGFAILPEDGITALMRRHKRGW